MKFRSKKNIINNYTLFLLACVFFSVFTLISCTDSNQGNATEQPKNDITPSNTLWGVDMTFMDSSQTKAKLHAQHVRLYSDRQETMFDTNIRVDFFSATGSRNAQLTCDSAKVDNKTNNMWAFGHVLVISDSSQNRVETNSMMWDNLKRKLYSNEYVKISRPGEVIEGGVGFESDESISNYRIFKVTGIKQQ